MPFQDNEVDPQFAAEMKDAALSLRAMENSRDTLDSDVRAAQDQIKSRLREKGVRKIPGVLAMVLRQGTHRVTITKQSSKPPSRPALISISSRHMGEPTDRLVITVT